MTLPPKKIAVAVSGGGRSLKNLILASANAPWIVAAVVSSSHDCGAVKIATDANLPVFIGDFSKLQRTQTAAVLSQFLSTHAIDWIILAGFLRLFPTLPAFQNKTINIHPALLPKFGGKGMHGHHVHEAVIASCEKKSGATVHFVNEKYDDGAIISQIEVDVSPDETAEQLAAKVFAAECLLLPWTLTELCEGRLPLVTGPIPILKKSAVL